MKFFVEQAIKNNLKLVSQLESLASVEERLYRTLSTSSVSHPQQTLRIKLPRNLRKLAILFEIREVLSVGVRVEVEQQYDSKMAHISSEELVQLSKLTCYLENPIASARWIQGRLPQLILESLEEIRISIRSPRSPKRLVRRRGYTDGSGQSTEQSRLDRSARTQADEAGRSEKKYLYNELTRNQIAAAEVILARERSGESAQAIGERPSAAQQQVVEISDRLDASQSTGPCEDRWFCVERLKSHDFHVPGPSCSSCPLVRYAKSQQLI